MTETLPQAVATLSGVFPEFANNLRLAWEYVRSDPPGSAAKCRIIVEAVARSAFERFCHSREGVELSVLLSDPRFVAAVPPRILARMQTVRRHGNAGAHGNLVIGDEAVQTLSATVEVLRWCSEWWRTDPTRPVQAQTPPEPKPAPPAAPSVVPAPAIATAAAPVSRAGEWFLGWILVSDLLFAILGQARLPREVIIIGAVLSLPGVIAGFILNFWVNVIVMILLSVIVLWVRMGL